MAKCAFFPMVKRGFPGEEILKTISKKEVDLVVLGTRGYSKSTGFLLGSVSQWVLQEAPCSVLIARPMPREKKEVRGMNLLLATDGSPDSRAAVDFIKTVELPPSSQITILHVVKKYMYETERTLTVDSTHGTELAKLAEELLKIRGRERAKLLEQTRKAISSHDFPIQERLVFGNPADEILKAARYVRADLIVIGVSWLDRDQAGLPGECIEQGGPQSRLFGGGHPQHKKEMIIRKFLEEKISLWCEAIILTPALRRIYWNLRDRLDP